VRRIWATAERVIPRGLVAVTTIVAAAATDPFAMGIYSWAVLAATFFGSLTELPMRQLAIAHVGSRSGRGLMRRAALITGFAGSGFMLLSIFLISGFSEDRNSTFFSLVPLIGVPAALAAAVQSTAQLQRVGLWGQISSVRFGSSLVAAAIGVLITLATESIVGASIAVTLSELLYAIFIGIAARRRNAAQPLSDSGDGVPVSVFWSSFRHMALFGSVGWLQSQSERCLIGIWAGTGALGLYSLAYAAARSAGEAIATSQANVLRVDLLAGRVRSDSDIRAVLGRTLRLELLLISGAAVAAVFGSRYALAPFLGPEWESALQMVPILVISTIPVAIATSSAPVHMQRGRSRVAFVAPTICLAFAPVVALAAVSSLTLAAWFCLLRECVLALIQSVLMMRATPWREVGLAAGLVAVGSAIVLATTP